jgi:membrane-bound metal-dependent hydrolase YbcI (DUF457 family)
MFIGHFGVAFGAKKIDRRISLGTLFLASQFIDLIWPVFILLGIEKVKIEPGNTAFTPLNFEFYPYSHSLLGVFFWAFLFGIVYFILKKKVGSSVLLGSLVLSHWILDYITHRPDLQIVPWSELRVGSGLWNSVIATFFVETLIYVVGVYIYLRFREGETNRKRAGSWSLVLILFAIYLMNIFGSAPPSENAIGIAGIGLWLFVGWAYLLDRKPG